MESNKQYLHLKYIFSKWFPYFICGIIGILLYPLLLLIVGLMFLFRLGISLIFKLFYKNEFSLVNPSDASLAVEEHANTFTINTFMYLEGQADISKLHERGLKMILFEETRGHQPYKKLMSRIGTKLGFYCWQDLSSDFDISHHIKICPGVDPYKIYTEDDLLQAIEPRLDNLFSDNNRPQWELLIFPKVKLAGKMNSHYGLVFRVNHSYMDGVSILQCLRKGFCDSPQQLIFDPVHPPMITPTLFQYTMHYLQVALLGPYCIYQVSRPQPESVLQDRAKNTGPKFLGCTNLEITVDTVKRIRTAFKCSTTSLFNSVFSGALHSSLIRKGLPCPEEISIGFTIAMIPYPNEDPQNRFTIAILTSSLAAPNPVKRLQRMGSSLRNLKPYQISSTFWLLKTVGLFPAVVVQLVVKGLRASYVFSNVPSFKDPLAVEGNPVVNLYGCPPISNGIGFGVGVCSYMNKFRITYMVEKSPVISSREDMIFLKSEIEKEFQYLDSASEAILGKSD